MPATFKALATISVWALFINGLGGMIWSAIDAFRRSGGMGAEPYHFADAARWTVLVICLFFAVIAMKLRKDLE